MSIQLLNPQIADQQAGIADQMFSQMRPGEIFASGGSTGMQDQFTAPGPNMNDPRDQIMQQTGYNDFQNSQRNPQQEFNRMQSLQQTGGDQMQMDVRDPFMQGVQQTGSGQYDQGQADHYSRLSDADKMAVEMVKAGKLDAVDFYKIKKTDEMKREQAMLDLMSRAGDRADVSKNGQPMPFNGQALNDVMSGQASVDFRDPRSISEQVINSTTNRTGPGGAGRGSKGTPQETTKDLEKLTSDINAAAVTYSGLASSSKFPLEDQQTVNAKLNLDRLSLAKEIFIHTGNDADRQQAESAATALLGTGKTVMNNNDVNPLIPTDASATGYKLNLAGIVNGRRVLDFFANSGNLNDVLIGHASTKVDDLLNQLSASLNKPIIPIPGVSR